MTNWEAWQLMLRDVGSPSIYVDWGFVSMISSALQRRVWLSDEDFMPVYPSMFTILTGPPATGKGNILKPVKDLLSYHKTPVNQAEFLNGMSHAKTQKQFAEQTGRKPEEIVIIPSSQADAKETLKRAQEALDGAKTLIYGASPEQLKEKTIFAIAPDALTYEDLLRNLAKSVFRHTFTKMSPSGKMVEGLYFYKSLTFILEELSSLFNKDAEKIVNYFLVAYDCRDYEYSTKTQGRDIITKPCVNILAGTTPKYIRKIFNSDLLNEGIGSRSFFIYAPEARRRYFMLNKPAGGELATQQLKDHLLLLSQVFGEVKLSTDALAYVQHAWESDVGYGKLLINKSPKLEYYYGRKNQHIMKVALALHFSENVYEMVIPLETVKRAIRLLNTAEVRMHEALQTAERNPIYQLQQDIIAFMRKEPLLSWSDVIKKFYYGGNELELKEAWKILAMQGIIEAVPNGGSPTSNGKVYYTLSKETSVEEASELEGEEL
jgi:hypothetical protein